MRSFPLLFSQKEEQVLTHVGKLVIGLVNHCNVMQCQTKFQCVKRINCIVFLKKCYYIHTHCTYKIDSISRWQALELIV